MQKNVNMNRQMESVIVQELMFSIDPLSSSSSDDDDERLRHKKVENYIENVVRFFSDAEFKLHFRMDRQSVQDIIDLYGNHRQPVHKGGWPQVSNEKAVLITVWYLANTETFRQISDRFDVAPSCAYNVVKNVTNVIVRHSSNFIRWCTYQEAIVEESLFRRKRGFRNVIGVIDGSHIRINKPKVHSQDYVNRKGFHSILIQGVVNSKKMFFDISVGEPGSMHDARMSRKTRLYRTVVEQPESLFLDKYRLIGDSAYPSFNWLVTPIADNGLITVEERRNNYIISSTRVVVEHSFGLLKGRFRRLRGFENHKIPFIVNCTVAACVFHNICIQYRDEFHERFIEED